MTTLASKKELRISKEMFKEINMESSCLIAASVISSFNIDGATLLIKKVFVEGVMFKASRPQANALNLLML